MQPSALEPDQEGSPSSATSRLGPGAVETKPRATPTTQGPARVRTGPKPTTAVTALGHSTCSGQSHSQGWRPPGPPGPQIRHPVPAGSRGLRARTRGSLPVPGWNKRTYTSSEPIHCKPQEEKPPGLFFTFTKLFLGGGGEPAAVAVLDVLGIDMKWASESPGGQSDRGGHSLLAGDRQGR